MKRSAPSVLLLGATGYTGQLVARTLQRAGQPFVMAARDPARLEALAAEIGDLATAVPLNVRDPETLATLIQPGDVVINCVGPFTELGEPVIEACIGAGASYVDTSGEQSFIRAVHTRHDAAAREANVAIVPGMAFEYALGDCATAIAGTGLARPIRTVDIIYSWLAPTSSRGTRRTVVRMLGRRGITLEQGRLVVRPNGARRRRVTMSSGSPLEAVSFNSGEVVTVPRHMDVDTVRGWAVTGRGTARIAPILAPALPLLITVFRPLVEAIATRRPDPGPEERLATLVTIRVEAHDRIGLRRAVELRGRDPYGLTAEVIVAGARRAMAADAPRGVLAPAQLVDPHALVASLRPLGLRLVENA